MKQKLCFVSTAPLAGAGRVDRSPKAMATFRILDDKTVAYIESTGSGAETVSSLRENGRIVFMIRAFEGPPKGFRFHGRGSVFERVTPEYEAFIGCLLLSVSPHSIRKGGH